MAKQFKYERIAGYIRTRIEVGEYRAGEKLPSTQELAERFDTSVITANKALNHLVGENLVTRSPGVGTVVVDQGAVTAGGPIRHTALIGAIVFDIAHPFWSGAIRGIEEVCRSQGYNLLIGNDDGDLKKAKSYINSFIARGVEGLIFVPIGHREKGAYEAENRQIIARIEETALPYILMHRRLETYTTPVAQIENSFSAYEGTRLLLRSGVENPICISHYYSQVSRERELGFIQALEEEGFTDAPQRIYRLHPAGQTVDIRQLQEVETLMKNLKSVDGVFSVAIDMLAIVLQAMNQRSLWEEVKIVSFDFNHELFGHKGVVAMLDTPSVEMGSQAAHYLLRSINGQTLHRMQTSIYPQFHLKETYADVLDESGYLIKNHVKVHGK